MSKPAVILHITTSLAMGGAEKALLNLLEKSDRNRYRHVVVCLTEKAVIGDILESQQINVFYLNISGIFDGLKKLITLAKIIKQQQPGLIQCWMYHANLFGALMKVYFYKLPLIWSIHHNQLTTAEKKSTRVIARVGALLSWLIPQRIVCCAHSSLLTHKQLGYKASKMQVLVNGVDTIKFNPVATIEQKLRKRIKLQVGERLVASVGRYHPVKDYPNLLKAAKLAIANNSGLKFVIIGQGVDEQPLLQELLRELDIVNHVFLMGQQDNIASLLTEFDVFVLASESEAFPNVLIEAMACGIPCISTDVGDCAAILSDIGEIVPAKKPQALAVAITTMVDNFAVKKAIALEGVAKVKNLYDISVMTEKYQQVYQQLLTGSE